MRRISLLCVMFLAGCLNVTGPFAPKPAATRIDDPRLSVSEKDARVRERWAVPDPALKLGPVDQGITVPNR